MLIRRTPPWMLQPPNNSNAESMEKFGSMLMRGRWMGRNQKRTGFRYDTKLLGGVKGEIKFSKPHTYRNNGFRHSFSGLFGTHNSLTEGEYYLLIGERQLDYEGENAIDSKFFFLFFSRSQLKQICGGNTLNLPVNWEPGSPLRSFSCSSADKNLSIKHAVKSAKQLYNISFLIKENPNDPSVSQKIKISKRPGRHESEILMLKEKIKELEAKIMKIQNNSN